jgi:hypothetical protein
MDDEAARLLDAIERLESRLNSYWNFYTLVVLATVGWLMSAANPFSANQSVAVTVALGLFFLANLSVIRGATRRILALEDELRLLSAGLAFRSPRLRQNFGAESIPGRMPLSYALHLAVDAAVIYAVWSKLA